MQSEVDTKTKVFTIHTEDTQAEGLLSGTYDYSIEKDTLTLTEREYGDHCICQKRKEVTANQMKKSSVYGTLLL